MKQISALAQGKSANSGKWKEKFAKTKVFSFSYFVLRFLALFLLLTAYCLPITVQAQNKYEDRAISNIFIRFENSDRDVTNDGRFSLRDISAAEQFRTVVKNALGGKYSTVKMRDALQGLYDTEQVVFVSAQAIESSPTSADLRFVIKRKIQAEKVNIVIGNTLGEPVTEQQLLLKLNLLNPGTAVTEKTLDDNANLILVYLRERGYFNSEVTYSQKPIGSETEVAVTFQVTPNTQSRVRSFNINIEDFDPKAVRPKLELQPGEFFSREILAEDLAKIRKALRGEKFLAPELEEPRIEYDSKTNTVDIELKGKVGAVVNVTVEGAEKKLGEKTQIKLLSVKREGTLDYAAIIEGERRLRNYYQEQGYFFADVKAVCSVKPEFAENEASVTTNETDVLCSALTGPSLKDRVVDIKYQADLNRRLKLVDIRLEGTDKINISDIQTVLKSQEKSVIGIIPYLGYGRGYTSAEILEDDRLTVQSLMRELGYRRAQVTVRQGVSPNGEDLIITFVVDEGIPTRIKGVEIRGNKAFTAAELEAKLPNIVGKNFSRARARNGVREIAEFYSEQGYYDAKINYSLDKPVLDESENEELVTVIFNVENEGGKVFVNRILINGNELTDRDAILKAINLRSGEVLRATDIFTSEQSLYSTDAFSLVEIKPVQAGERDDGSSLRDIIINVEEQKPRLITYGGGFSTDIGANGFFDIRHFNLFGKLQQGGARIRASRLQQLVQIDFINPRFMPDGKGKTGTIRYAPLSFTAQYQRDSTITRFFRTSFDRGTGGIVQRVDEDGNPIDEFGAETGSPTINRLSLSAETSRTISTKKRSILFVRFRYEDVRLFNFESLLVKDLLRPDAKVRISGLGANFVFDTRENCSIKYTLLEIIAKGDPTDACRYSPNDPTNGNFLTAEYNFSLPALGANIGFQKFQGSYYTFYTLPRLKNTTLAGRAVLGLANVFSQGQRFSSAQFSDLDDILPISERFFGGGSTTLRGFEFEAAGPRVAIVPQGIFRNQKGEPVYLNPFTVPFGGNALAIVNLEARIPVSENVRVVPFYDGGNVFRRVKDIFNPPDVDPNDVFRSNLRAVWTHTFGLGFRVKTPIGGEFAIDYGYLLKPPQFLIPQTDGSNAIYRLRQGQLHFRFAQAF